MTPEEKIRQFLALPPQTQRAKIDALSREQKVEFLRLMEEYTRRKAKDSLSVFAGRRNFVPAAHHKLMIEHLEALERYDVKNLMMCLPPGSAKSTYSSVLFPAWFMGRHPEAMLILTSNTMELAETFGRRIRNIVGHADFRAEFGFGLSSDSTAAARWSNEKGGELLGAGVGGSIVGRRCDCLVMDDVVRSKEDVNSETLRERTWAWYTADVLTRLKPRARQVFCNTRWHEDDLAGRILDRDASDWTVLKLEMENTREDDPLGRDVGGLLWPEWFTDEMVARAKQDPVSWSALYQQNPSPEGGGEFKKAWVEFYDTPPNRKNTTNLIIVDPANEKSRTSDFTAIWVVGMGGDGNAYILDAVRDRLNLAERTDALFRLHRKYKPVEVRYEQYGMQSDIAHLKIEMDRLSYRFRIREVRGKVKKEDRIRRLIPWFKEGRAVFPRELLYTDLAGKTHDLVRIFVEEELAAFPVAKHDDMLDALSRMAEPGLVLPRHVPEEERKLMFADEQFAFQPIDEVMGY